MKTILSAVLWVPLASSCSQLAPEHGRERIYTLGIGIVDRTTTAMDRQPHIIQVPQAAQMPAASLSK